MAVPESMSSDAESDEDAFDGGDRSDSAASDGGGSRSDDSGESSDSSRSCDRDQTSAVSLASSSRWLAAHPITPPFPLRHMRNSQHFNVRAVSGGLIC